MNPTLAVEWVGSQTAVQALLTPAQKDFVFFGS